MRTWIDKLLKPYLIVIGLVTMLPGLLVIRPTLGLSRLFQLTLPAEAMLIVQHWGAMLFLVGVLMVIAAFRSSLVWSVMLYATLEKSAIALLAFVYRGQPWAEGFQMVMVMDGCCALYGFLYLYSTGRRRVGP
jgi:uncharacterized membrane protein HdeD (DUF308 family)